MRDSHSLQTAFDTQDKDELVIEGQETANDSFVLPIRNWNALIDSYNASHKRKFPFSALQCKVIVEYVKKSIPARYVFQTIGVSPQRYGNLVTLANDLEDRLELLASKQTLTEEEYEEFNLAMRHPMRVLMSDIARAEGISNLTDWETFNDMATKQPDILMAKMRSKFKEIFNEKEGTGQNLNVQINLGGDDWIKEV